MYNIIDNVINRGDFILSNILEKINSLWAENKISSEQRDRLIQSARSKASASSGIDIVAEISNLELRIRQLENTVNGIPSVERIDEYVVGKTYYNGDKITFNGKHYMCLAPEGAVCVWSPADYPNYWGAI